MSALESVIAGRDFEVKDIGSPLGFYKDCAPRIKCLDGTTLSVQASRTHYCDPRDNFGPYFTVEVGFPSTDPPESWRDYIDGDWDTDDRTGTVYGHVPVGLVREFVELHGGEA